MAMTTVGTDYSPTTAEGRLLAWLLSLYAIGVFGYLTATIASHFLGLDAERRGEANQAVAAELAELRREVAALRRQLERPG